MNTPTTHSGVKLILAFSLSCLGMKPLEALPKELLEAMKKLVKETEKDGRERALAICRSPSGQIFPGNEITGTEDGFPSGLVLECPDDSEIIGHFHTHPKATPFFSLRDIKGFAKNEWELMNCLGTPHVHYFICTFRDEDRPNVPLEEILKGRPLWEYALSALYDWNGVRRDVGESAELAFMDIGYQTVKAISKLYDEEDFLAYLTNVIYNAVETCHELDRYFPNHVIDEDFSSPSDACKAGVDFFVEKELREMLKEEWRKRTVT